MKKNKLLSPSEWKKRRLRIDLFLASGFIWLTWIIFTGTDTVLYQQISIAILAAMVTVIGQYVFGAVFDDKNFMNAVVKQNGTTEGNSNSSDTTDEG